MEEQRTQRGFALVLFEDVYSKACSLQESSSATEQRIWLGCDDYRNLRMHLNQELVRQMLPYLQRFVETGYLAEQMPEE